MTTCDICGTRMETCYCHCKKEGTARILFEITQKCENQKDSDEDVPLEMHWFVCKKCARFVTKGKFVETIKEIVDKQISMIANKNYINKDDLEEPFPRNINKDE